MNPIAETFKSLADVHFENPGWMDEFFEDVVRNKQYIVMVDDSAEVSSFICYWKFGNKRWGFMRKCTYRDIDKCPKQMGKGTHLYVPLFWAREDRIDSITIKQFIDMLKRECPEAKTLSWHDSNNRFVTYRLIRSQDNGNIQYIREEGSTCRSEC